MKKILQIVSVVVLTWLVLLGGFAMGIRYERSHTRYCDPPSTGGAY